MTKALWRRAFDTVESAAAPRLEALVREPAFRTAVVVVRRTTAFAASAGERQSRRFWHTLNLPTGSDVRQLRRQIGALDREVRLLQEASAPPRAARDRSGTHADLPPKPAARKAGTGSRPDETRQQ